MLEILCSPAQETVDLTRVVICHEYHYQKHGKSIKDVDEDLVGHQISVISLEVLGHTERGSDQDENAGDVQVGHVLLPGTRELNGCFGRVSSHVELENNGGDAENPEEDYLDEQSANDDVFTTRRVG